MDKLQELFNQRLEKIDQLNDFIALFGKKTELIERLIQLKEENEEAKLDVEQIRKDIELFKTKLVPQYHRVMEMMHKQQMYLLNVIEALPAADAPVQQQSFHNATTPNVQAPNTTPRMSIQQYQNSPFVKRVRPTSLQFVDFETAIEQQTFAKIPQYIKGRETLDELRTFLNDIIIPCFTYKYKLLYKHRDSVRNNQDMALWKVYHQQIEYFPNQMFITQGDIANLTGKMLDKKSLGRITMLRHIQILQESRKNSTVCYIWLK